MLKNIKAREGKHGQSIKATPQSHRLPKRHSGVPYHSGNHGSMATVQLSKVLMSPRL